MRNLIVVYVIYGLLLISGIGCGKEKANDAAAAPQSLPAWSQGDQDDFMNGCITTAHTSKPSYTFPQVQTYCQCTLTASMKLWSASAFAASNNADAQTLYDNGTVAGCKTQAGVQ